MNAKSINPKCIISRDEAFKLAPDLVSFTEGNEKLFDKVNDAHNGVKRRQKCVVAFKNWEKRHASVYALVQVTSVNNHCYQAVDGPVIRITDGKYSWRTDGSDWIAPIKD